MEVKRYYVYILASRKNGTLYIGVTNDLLRRVREHKCGAVPGFTTRYGVDKLVYYETFTKVYDALTAEKRLKAWKRHWKIELIEEHNPQWHDVYGVLTGQLDSCFRRNDRVDASRSSRFLRAPVCPRRHSHARSALDLIAGGNPRPARPQKGFTLIELLVVVAIIALLMAILVPCLQRVRRQARTVGCQSNLKQWSLIFAMYANENNGRFPNWVETVEPWPQVLKALWPYHRDTNDLFLCPMARKPPRGLDTSGDSWIGSTFSPWLLRGGMSPVRLNCSYGLNIWAQYSPGSGGSRDPRYWQTVPAQGAANAPLLLDSVLWWSCRRIEAKPPAYENIWTDSELPCCMNRHDGFVCGNFMDWSVRKIGVKELWSLKWHREYDTRGIWTKAGGVQPDQWPAWMRRFKDY